MPLLRLFNHRLLLLIVSLLCFLPDPAGSGSETSTETRADMHQLVNNVSLGRLHISGTWVAATGRPYTAPESEYTLTLLDGTEQSYIHVGDKNGLRLPAYHRADIAAHYCHGVILRYGILGVI